MKLTHQVGQISRNLRERPVRSTGEPARNVPKGRGRSPSTGLSVPFVIVHAEPVSRFHSSEDTTEENT